MCLIRLADCGCDVDLGDAILYGIDDVLPGDARTAMQDQGDRHGLIDGFEVLDVEASGDFGHIAFGIGKCAVDISNSYREPIC